MHARARVCANLIFTQLMKCVCVCVCGAVNYITLFRVPVKLRGTKLPAVTKMVLADDSRVGVIGDDEKFIFAPKL